MGELKSVFKKKWMGEKCLKSMWIKSENNVGTAWVVSLLLSYKEKHHVSMESFSWIVWIPWRNNAFTVNYARRIAVENGMCIIERMRRKKSVFTMN